MTSSEQVDFILVTALPGERDALLDKLPDPQKVAPSETDIYTYYKTELPVTFSNGITSKYHVVVMPLSERGQVQAATAATTAIARWDPRYVILVGIAGGINSEDGNKMIHLGDVLISDQIVVYELQKITEQGTDIHWEVMRADPRLLNASQNFRDTSWQKQVTAPRPRAGESVCHTGPIASGDKTIALAEVVREYQGKWSQLIGIETEAGGIATAAFNANNPPGFFMVKGVAALADKDEGGARAQAWCAYACDIAASYVIAFLESGPVPPSDDFVKLPVETQLPTPRALVGRTQEISALQQTLSAGFPALIVGGPGIGKTTLASHLFYASDEKAEHLYWFRFRQDPNISVFLRRLAGFLYWQDMKDVWHRIESSQSANQIVDPEEIFPQILKDLRTVKELKRHNCVLWLDDCHYLEKGSLLGDFVNELYQAAQGGQFTLIMSGRSPLDFLLVEANPTHLSGLSQSDISELFAQRGFRDVSEATLEKLHDYTQGNSKLLVLLLASLQQKGEAVELQLSPLIEKFGQPEATTEKIEQWLLEDVDASLSPLERQIMYALSILGGDAATYAVLEAMLTPLKSLDEIIQNLCTQEKRLVAVTQNLCKRDLIEAGINAYAQDCFVQHDIVRGFYYKQLGERERQALMRQAATYYASSDQQPIRTARLYDALGEYELAAIEYRKGYEPKNALKAFSEALKHTKNPTKRLELYYEIGQILYRIGRFKESGETYQQILRTLNILQSNPKTRLETGADLSRIEEERVDTYYFISRAYCTEHPKKAIAAAKQGLDLLGEETNARAAELLWILGVALGNLGEMDEAEMNGQKALQLAQDLAILEINSDEIQARIYRLLGSIAGWRGQRAQEQKNELEALRHLTQALEYHEQSLALYQEQNRYAEIGKALSNVATAHDLLGNTEQALAFYYQALEINQKTGDQASIAIVYGNLGCCYKEQENWEQAEAYLKKALEIWYTLKSPENAADVELDLGETYYRQARWEEARQHLTIAERAYVSSGYKTYLFICYIWLAEAFIGLEQWDEAADAAQKALNQVIKNGKREQKQAARGLLKRIRQMQGG